MKNLTTILTIVILGLSISSVHATNPISAEAFKEQSLSTKTLAEHSIGGKFKLWIAKKVTRYINSSTSEMSEAKINRLAKLALTLGVLSVLSHSLIFLIGFGSFYVAFPLATMADILAFRVLNATSKNKAKYKKARGKAATGLALGLLSGLIPLGLFILVLASLQN